MHKAMLLCLKKCQARCEERGLFIANERRTPQHGVFLGTTCRVGSTALFSENTSYNRTMYLLDVCYVIKL